MKHQEQEDSPFDLAAFDMPADFALGSMTRAQLLSTRMEWGAYEGLRVIDLPLKYLIWLARTCRSITARMREALEEFVQELEAEGFGTGDQRPRPFLVNGPAMAEAWKAEMLKRHGSRARVRLIKEGFDVLQQMIHGNACDDINVEGRTGT